MSRVNEILDMSRIIGKDTFRQLAAVPGEDKHFHGPPQRMNAARETTRFTRQTGQIVTQFGIVCLNRIRLAFVRERLMATRIVNQRVIGGEFVGIVSAGLGTAVQHGLHGLRGPFPDHIPPDNAPRDPIDLSYDVDAVFLC